jgi:hypothetical protein
LERIMDRKYVSFITKTGTGYKDSRNKFKDDHEFSTFYLFILLCMIALLGWLI